MRCMQLHSTYVRVRADAYASLDKLKHMRRLWKDCDRPQRAFTCTCTCAAHMHAYACPCAYTSSQIRILMRRAAGGFEYQFSSSSHFSFFLFSSFSHPSLLLPVARDRFARPSAPLALWAPGPDWSLECQLAKMALNLLPNSN